MSKKNKPLNKFKGKKKRTEIIYIGMEINETEKKETTKKTSQGQREKMETHRIC